MKKKKKIGRPLKYKSPDVMQEKIDAYFLDCDKRERPYTVTGLAYALDMCRRQLIEYAEKGEFNNTITRARQKVEISMEELLLQNGGNRGVIFNLINNFNWHDKSEVEHTGDVIINLTRAE